MCNTVITLVSKNSNHNPTLMYSSRSFAGVETRVPGFGDSHAVDYADDNHFITYYKDLVDGIMSLPGAKEGVSVRSAPFDFRYSPPSKESCAYFDRFVSGGIRWILQPWMQKNAAPASNGTL